MKARKGYIQQKGQYSTGKWLKRYFTKRTCKQATPQAYLNKLYANKAMFGRGQHRNETTDIEYRES